MIKRLRNNSLVSGAGIYIVATLINASIPFLLLPVLTRYLTPEEYGGVAVFQVWCSLVAVLCGLNTFGAATRKYYDFDEPDKFMGDYITACVVVLFISSLVILVLIFPFMGSLSELLGLPGKWILAGLIYAAANFLLQLRLRQWQVRKNPIQYGKFQIAQSGLNAGLSLVLVVVFGMGLEGRLTGITVAMLVFGSIASLLLLRDRLLTVSWRPDLMKDALSFSLPLLPHFIGSFLLMTVDRAVISAVLGLEAAGHYMVAVQLSLALNLVLQSIHRAYVPWLFERIKRGSSGEKKRIVKGTYLYFGALSVIALLAFWIGGPVLVFIAGANYAIAGEIIGWLVFAQALRGMYYMVSSYLIYAKCTKEISLITIFSGTLNVGLLFLLLEGFGLVGAAWAMCIGAGSQFLLAWFGAARAISMPWSPRKALAA